MDEHWTSGAQESISMRLPALSWLPIKPPLALATTSTSPFAFRRFPYQNGLPLHIQLYLLLLRK